MDNTKREELKKACKKEKDHKVRARMVAVRMIRVFNMTVEEAADILVRCPTWIRKWLRRYDDGGSCIPSKGSPYLNAMEECRRQGKRRLLVSEY